MPSPFPGMNPYLEQEDAWHDFHERFIPWIADRIAAQVDPRYIVKIDEHVYIHETPEDRRRLLGRADVERESFVEIRDCRSRQLVTAIELLSPANKRPGPDRDQYLAKRSAFLAGSAHFVEIDLLRGGQRMPVDCAADCDYCVLVSRVETRPRAGLWPLGLRDRLPVIPIPLRAPDADATLDLQEGVHEIYDRARYATYLYEISPDPPLPAADDTWAQQLVTHQGS